MVCSADYFKLFQGRRMDELFTFNSRQLQNITNRQKPPAQSPKYRKRILSAKLSKKLARASSPAENTKDTYTDRKSAKSNRKVTFNIPIPSACLNRLSGEEDDLIRQPRSVILLMKKSNNEGERKAGESQQQQNGSNNLIRKLVKRAFSTVQRNQGRLMEDSIVDQKNEASIPERRQKRTNSAKGSPKVLIPLNNKKLPEVFKLKLGQKRVLKDKKLESRFLEERGSSNNSFPNWLNQQICVPLAGLNRWKNVFNLQDKLFQRLYGRV